MKRDMPERLPEIMRDLIDFFNCWQNPDNEKGKCIPIKDHQIIIYAISPNFIFKWRVDKKKFRDAATFLNKKNKRLLRFMVGEYDVELTTS